ncbi:MAG: HNH endonuclease signature motif containing protein [Acidobacteriota bacterium]
MARVKIPAALRRLVIERAKECCEYCLLHEEDAADSHQVDHVVALKHGGQTTSDNLALACTYCNRHKGSDLTTIDPIDGSLVTLFNPRAQEWGEHFALAGALLTGLTPTGRVTIVLLRMNDPVRVDQRRQLIEDGRYRLHLAE